MSKTVDDIMQEYEAAWMASLEFYSDSDGVLKYKVNADMFKQLFPYKFESIEKISLADLVMQAETVHEGKIID